MVCKRVDTTQKHRKKQRNCLHIEYDSDQQKFHAKINPEFLGSFQSVIFIFKIDIDCYFCIFSAASFIERPHFSINLDQQLSFHCKRRSLDILCQRVKTST
jgi:hypothetical protein